jgi:NAD(P)-dependent dehydrogenase (short-subunit alcohol dehydrogenase family)
MMSQHSGSIVNIASTSAVLVRRRVPNSVYGPSKAAVVMLTKALAEEWAPFGVRVNCVAPGRLPTDLSESLAPPNSPEFERLLEMIPMGRLGEPQDITQPVLFLSSPLSGYITGQTLFVDGGRTIL